MYLRTVRGEIRIPSLSRSSLAIRSSPHSTFSRAILRISSRSSFGIGGRPARDFIRQSSLQPARCQRIIVAGCTATNAPRQSKSLASTAKLTRVAASTRYGWIPRSMYRASCRILDAQGLGRPKQEQQPPEGVFDEKTCDPQEADHALMVPRLSAGAVIPARPSGMDYLRSTSVLAAELERLRNRSWLEVLLDEL